MADKFSALNNITKDLTQKDFLGSDINVRAKKDFAYLCNQTGYNCLNNVGYQSVKTADEKVKSIGDFLIIGYDTAEKVASFPQKLLDPQRANTFVAVVVYKDDEVQDVLVFKASEFIKPKLFSIYKVLKNGTYAINIGGGLKESFKQYSFGYVLKNL